MLVIKITPEALGNVSHINVLRARWEDIRLAKYLQLIDSIWIDPSVDPASDGWEVRGRTNKLHSTNTDLR